MVEEVKKQETPKVEENDMVTRATAAADALRKENEKMEQLLKRQEEILSRQILGGQTNNAPAPVQKEESPKEYVARLLKTGKA